MTAFAVFWSSVASGYAMDFVSLPGPRTIVPLSLPFQPMVLKGVKVHSKYPFRFDFILDKGSGAETDNERIRNDSACLVRYFLTALTVPEKDLWVNLSPYEKDRMVPGKFGKTEMARDLLAEDYILKQVAASLIFPEGKTGKLFWKRVYEEAARKYGTTDVPVDTFNKVWIVPDKASVYENVRTGAAYVVEARLKVMLESDYLAFQKNAGGGRIAPGDERQEIARKVLREVAIPVLEKEVNEGGSFGTLRQIYHSLILAAWYKKKMKGSLLNTIYADCNKIDGVGTRDPGEKEQIYQQYLKSFERGVFNLIESAFEPATLESLPRKYFSGGVLLSDKAMKVALQEVDVDPELLMNQRAVKVTADLAASSNSKLVDQSMLSRVITRFCFVSAMVLMVGMGGYVRWGYDLSWKYLLEMPTAYPIPEHFQSSDVLSRRQEGIRIAISEQRADREFWEGILSDYPSGDPVSAVITMDVLESADKTGQLDHLFNAFRTKSDLVYRYLSEIAPEKAGMFALRFSHLKPGTRQQLFEILTQHLAEDFQRIENGRIIKSVLDRRAVAQAERLRHLYGEMTRMLNRIHRPAVGDVPEGPLWDVPTEPTAPFEEVSFTRQQAVDALYKAIEDSIEVYRSKGYAIVMPAKGNVNIVDIEGLVSHYMQNRGAQSYYVDNSAGLLLQWIRETTSLDNPGAHRITQGELIDKVFSLSVDPESKKLDLLKAFASLGHLFKGLARNPGYILGAPEAMGGDDGVDYIWHNFQPGIIAGNLYLAGAVSVDDQGRPVMHWRPVDRDGNESIPAGQRTGILRPDSGHDFYHFWGTLPLFFYLQQKGFFEVKADAFPEGFSFGNFSEGLLRLNMSAEGKNVNNFLSDDMRFLPLFFKICDRIGFTEYKIDRSRFSAKGRADAELASYGIAARLSNLVSEKRIHLDAGLKPQIAVLDNEASSLKRSWGSLPGGIDPYHYAEKLDKKWQRVSQQGMTQEIMEQRALLVVAAQQLLELKVSGLAIELPEGLSKVLLSSARELGLSETELSIWNKIFERLFHSRFGLHHRSIQAPLIWDVLVLETNPDNLVPWYESDFLWRGHLHPDTFQHLAKHPVRSVREAILYNPNLPVSALREFIFDPDPLLVEQSLQQLKKLNQDEPNDVVDGVSQPLFEVRSILSPNTPFGTRLKSFFNLKRQGDGWNRNTILWFSFGFHAFGNSQILELLDKWMKDNQDEVFPDEFYARLNEAGGSLHEVVFSWDVLNGFRQELRQSKTAEDVAVVINKLIALSTKTAAGGADNAMLRPPGGIDLTPTYTNLRAITAGREIEFHLNKAQLQQLKDIQGFLPVIIDIQSMEDVSGFLFRSSP